MHRCQEFPLLRHPFPAPGGQQQKHDERQKNERLRYLQNHLFEIKHHSRFSKSTITESYTHHVFRDFFFQRHFCSPPVPSTMTTALKKHNDAQKWEVKFDEQNYEDKDQNERTKLKDKIERKKYGGQKWGDKVERQHWKTKLKDKILLGNNLR